MNNRDRKYEDIINIKINFQDLSINLRVTSQDLKLNANAILIMHLKQLYHAIEDSSTFLLFRSAFPFLFLALNILDTFNRSEFRSKLSATLHARTIRIAMSHPSLGKKREKNRQEEARRTWRGRRNSCEIFAAKQIRAGRGCSDLLPSFF